MPVFTENIPVLPQSKNFWEVTILTLYPVNYKHHPGANPLLPLKFSKHSLPNGYVAHRHDFLEFSFVLEGTGWETINGIRYRKLPGSFTFVLPYQVHEIFTDPGSCLKLYNAEFSMDLLFDSDGQAGMRGILLGEDPPLASHVQLQGETYTHMARLMDELYHEYSDDRLWRIPLVRAKITEVLVCFDRLRRSVHLPLSQQNSAPNETSKLARSEKTLWSIIQYIHMHYQEELTLSSLCSQFHLSVSHLSDLLKRQSGQTFLQILHEVRIRHACGLLSSTQMSMEHIAMEVGYGSYKTFSRIFKQHKKATPSDYRKSHQLQISFI